MKSGRAGFLVKAFVVVALASAATASADYFMSIPTLNVRVHWSTPEELQQRCGTTAGCSTGTTPDKPYVQIYAQKPLGWEDNGPICDLGDQLLALSQNPNANVASAPVMREPAATVAASR